jgi:hypothetical protein
MVTPTKTEIYELARQRFAEHSIKNGMESITPTDSELRENGYVSQAISELMRDDIKAQAEEWEDYNGNLDNFEKKDFDSEEALKSGCYISGTSGSGKSDLGMLHAEQLVQKGVTVIVFDNSLDWVKRSSIPYSIKIREGEHFQYSFDLGKSWIFDMSLLNIEQQKQLVKMVCSELWRYQVRRAQAGKTLQWFYLIFEEGHNYFPQGCMRSKEYAEVVQILTGGRNFKIRFEAITQFSSMIDKNAMRYMKQRYFSYSDEPNDIDYISGFLGREHSKKLTELKSGQFLYKYGREIIEIEIEPYETLRKPEPYPNLMNVQAQAEPEQAEPQEPDLLQLAQWSFQIGSLLIFLIVVAIAFSSW